MAVKAGISSLIEQGQGYKNKWAENQKTARDEVSSFQADGIEMVTSDPEIYLNYLNAQAMNPHMSAGNIAAALAQNKDVTMMATADKWQKLGRTPIDGTKENVIKMLAQQKNNPKFYEVIELYDISQTSGKEQPPNIVLKNGTPEMAKAIVTLSRFSPAELKTCEMQGAIYDHNSKTILYSEEMTHSEAFNSLSTEIAFAKIHKAAGQDYDRETYTIDAQSVGYVLSKRFGVEANPPELSNVADIFKDLSADGRRDVLNSINNMSKEMGKTIEREINPPQKANTRGTANRDNKPR